MYKSHSSWEISTCINFQLVNPSLWSAPCCAYSQGFWESCCEGFHYVLLSDIIFQKNFMAEYKDLLCVFSLPTTIICCVLCVHIFVWCVCMCNVVSDEGRSEFAGWHKNQSVQSPGADGQTARPYRRWKHVAEASTRGRLQVSYFASCWL